MYGGAPQPLLKLHQMFPFYRLCISSRVLFICDRSFRHLALAFSLALVFVSFRNGQASTQLAWEHRFFHQLCRVETHYPSQEAPTGSLLHVHLRDIPQQLHYKAHVCISSSQQSCRQSHPHPHPHIDHQVLNSTRETERTSRRQVESTRGMLDYNVTTASSAITLVSRVTRHGEQHASIGGGTGGGGGSDDGGVKDAALWRKVTSALQCGNRAECDSEWRRGGRVSDRCVSGRVGLVLVPWERRDSTQWRCGLVKSGFGEFVVVVAGGGGEGRGYGS